MSVHKHHIEKTVEYLRQLDFETDEIETYTYLLQHGPQTVLSLSRGLKTGRTKLYPLLERLKDRQLVAIHERHYGTSYEANEPSVIEFLVNERELASKQLRSDLPSALHALTELQQISPVHSKIIEYHGVDGLKQMNWNLGKATGEYRVFELAGLDKHLGKHFADKMRTIFEDKKLTSYDLTNRKNRTIEPGSDVQNAHFRYIDPKVFSIEFETYIYNNVVGLLSYDKDDIFGVEIYNDRLARQQKQIFDMLWRQAS